MGLSGMDPNSMVRYNHFSNRDAERAASIYNL